MLDLVSYNSSTHPLMCNICTWVLLFFGLPISGSLFPLNYTRGSKMGTWPKPRLSLLVFNFSGSAEEILPFIWLRGVFYGQHSCPGCHHLFKGMKPTPREGVVFASAVCSCNTVNATFLFCHKDCKLMHEAWDFIYYRFCCNLYILSTENLRFGNSLVTWRSLWDVLE